LIKNYKQPFIFEIIRLSSYVGSDDKDYSFVSAFEEFAKRFNLDLNQYPFFQRLPDESYTLGAASVSLLSNSSTGV
jgi:hypothetical protein